MNKKIRAFYAIELNSEVRNAALHVIEQLKICEWSEHVRWTPTENLHLTIRFLGDVTEDQLTQLNAAIRPRLANIAPFSIMFKEPRLFPHFKKPRVVAAIIPHNDALNALAEILESCAVAAGLEPEARQFKGHLTLGRCNKSFPKRTKLDSIPFSSKLPVTRVSLFQSHLSSEGPTYNRLAELPLGIDN
ncbi:MAG: RNA 2',3'-cyclic phosphodiesterase [Gammaproteobacteria bacterium]|nr:RNA 2',3'-cyclic phosphodiesterase [Gammaproteobacteria bacterium]